jgi:hypothetical protein
MNYADARFGDIQNGYKCIEEAKDRYWAIFKLDNSEEWTEEQRLEWQAQNRQRRQQQAKEDDEKRRRSLSRVERDKQYRELLTQLTLHPEDRADLVKRGFTQQQIELSGFKSVERYHQLQKEFSSLLPGITGDGKRLIVSSVGYLCPVRDIDGLIVACQIRLRSLPASENNRYRWLSGNGQTLHLYPDGGKPNGELPLAVHLPQKLNKFAIGICEGVGAKPFLASQRLGIPFVGAAGGQHTSSPGTLETSLNQLKQALWEVVRGIGSNSISPPREVNKESLSSQNTETKPQSSYQKTSEPAGTKHNGKDTEGLSSYSTLNSSQWLNRQLSTSLPKTQDSTDSKCSQSEIQNLDFAEYQLSSQIELLITPDAGDTLNPSVMRRWQSIVELLERWGWSVTFAWWGQVDKTHPDIDELEDFSTISYIRPEEFWAIGKKEPKSLQAAESTGQGFDPEPQWKIKAKTAWRKNRQFLADVKESTQWCNFARPGVNTIAFFKAGLGRGKTTRLRAWVREWKQTEDVSFLCLGYRNTLLLQLCGDKKGLGFHHVHEHSGMAMKSAPSEGIALCVDSLWRFSPEDFDNKIIILDEVKSVIKHLLHSSTVKNRDKIISLFAEAIRRARQVICLDGLMADWVVDYLHSLAPEKQIIRAENTHIGEKPRVNFLLGTVGTDDKVKVNDRSPWLKYLLEDSPMPAVCSDSQVMIEGLDTLLSAKGLEVLRVDSKTVTEQHVKDFLLNCDEYIEKNKPDVLLYTPSAESGIDVSIPNHFTHHFAFFFGVLDIDGILQMIGRLRDNIVKFVWCKSFVADDERQHSGSPFTDQIAKSINEILIGDIASSADGDNWLEVVGNHLKTIIANSIDQNFRTSCIIKSIQNYEKSNLRECLREALSESGYRVVDCTLESYEDAGKKTRDATEGVKRQNCADIFRAEKVAPELVDELRFDASWDERCKVIQAKLREKLPGIEDSSAWSEDFIYLTRYDDRNFINNIENYWLFAHPDVAKRQSQDNLHWMARRLHTFIGNIKSRWARIHALLEMNFERFLDPDKEWSNRSPELIALLDLGKKHSNALGRHPGNATPVQFLGNLLGLLGFKLKSRKDSEGKRWYKLNEEILNDPIRQQVLTCVEAKLTQPKEKIDWESAIKEAHGIQTENQPETQAEQDSDSTAPSPKILYTNQLEGAVNNSTLESHDEDQVLGGVTEPVESMTAAKVEEVTEAADGAKLVEFLSVLSAVEAFAAVIEGYSEATVEDEDAIASQNTQPERLLNHWEVAAKVPAAEVVEVMEANEATRLSLEQYQPGQEVWAYFPQSCDRWLRGVIEWISGSTVKVKSGFLGTFVESPDAIAPGDWVINT